MQYSIWIVDSWPDLKGPNAKGHTRCFEEVALSLQSAFRELGHDVPIVDSLAKASGRVIVLGAGVLHRHKGLTLPDDAIIYNFEQVHEQARFFLPDNPYIDYLRRYTVWDYSENNIAELKKRGVDNVTLCGVGYMPELSRIAKADAEDIDILFIGSMHERRQAVISELKQRGLRVQVIQDMYGAPRDAVIARSKVILNVHLQPANVFEIVRVSYMLANRKCVVSEAGDDKALEGAYESAVVFRPYDELVSACLEYVSHTEKRRKQEEAGFAVFSRISQVPMLKAALDANANKTSPAVSPAPVVKAAKEVSVAHNPVFDTVPEQRRIFVNIASYRDPEINATIADMFAKADFPRRINAGVCLQIDEQKDSLCTINTDRPWQVRIRQFSLGEAKGANWARAQAQQLWSEEEYVLQIDSHMRFAKGWDSDLIAMLEACPSEKPVLSTYVPRYTPPDDRLICGDHLLRIRVHTFGEPGSPQLLHLTKTKVMLEDKERCGLYPSPFYIANFMFCRASMLQEIPFDPHIRFWGDEITFSARLWTHGYDIFQPDRVAIWHYWRRDELVKIQPYRRTDTTDSKRSMARIKHLLGFEITDDTMALTDMERYGLGNERDIGDLWAFAGVDWIRRSISKMAMEGRWDMAFRSKSKKKAAEDKKAASTQEAAAPAAKETSKSAATGSSELPRIFVQIPSYRDPDCQNTIKDLFDKAMHPERIFVGVCWQYIKDKDKDCFKVPYEYPKQVRSVEFDAMESKGVCWARSQTQKLWQGEEFTLQIDSHTRFEIGWDSTLIEMWKQCDSPKAILSCYPPAFVPPSTLTPGVFSLVAKEFDQEGVLLMKAKVLENVGRPALGAFVGAGMLFAPGSIISDVPYDPYLFFFGEEATLGARFWTHGYDLYHPNKTVAYHNWDREYRPTFFADHPDWVKLNQASYMRVKYLMGTELSTDSQAVKDIDKYGMGTARSFMEYQDFSGVDFAMKTIADVARSGEYRAYVKREEIPAEVPVARSTVKRSKSDKPLPRIYVQIPSYRDPDTQNTVKDLFDKANHPERVFVGICWQYIKGTDDDCFVVPYPYPDQVRVYEVDALESKGMCWARNITQSMWKGEEFTMSMDAHMRFEPGWDDTAIEVWENCNNPKAVLSVHPPKFDYPNTLSRDYVHGMSASRFDEHGVLMILGKPPYKVSEAPKKPMPGAIIGDGFLFGPGQMIKDVPFDPHLYFFGQEITVAVRLWTHGYDIYHPNKLITYHDYARPNRKHHVVDNQQDGNKRNMRAFERVRHMLKMEVSSDPEVLAELDIYGLGNVRTLEEYQDYAGIDFAKRTISDYAFAGKFPLYSEFKGMPTPLPAEDLVVDKPLHKKSFVVSRPGTIFINLASYRDPECQHTIKDLFEKANNPGRVFVGVCWQFDPEEDKNCFEIVTRRHQVRMLPVDWRDAEGVCWARYQAQQLWDGEEYVLMIDSHMRFVPGWDDLMIKELEACDSMKPMLSCSPASYLPPNKLSKQMNPSIRRVRPFMPDGNIRCQGEALDRRPDKPLNAAFMVANFAFSRAEVLAEVPYDPFLYFDQEEITYAARLYTHGWDVFSARQQFLYHYYNDVKAPGGSVRPLHWRDLRQADEKRIRYLRDRGLKRFNHITGYQESNEPDVIQRLDEFGWGRVRTLAQFEDYSGIDFKNKVASEKALRCWFIRDLARYRDRPIFVPELDDQKRIAAQGGVEAAQPVARVAGQVQQFGLVAPVAGHFQSSQSQSVSGQQPKPPVALVAMQPKVQHEDHSTEANSNQARVVVPVIPPAELSRPAPVTLLEPGDFMPMFQLYDHNGKKVHIERFGGKHTLMFFLPANDLSLLERTFRHIQAEKTRFELPNVWELYILDAGEDELKAIRQKLGIPHLLLSDPDRAISRSLGVTTLGEARFVPTGFVLNTNLRVVTRHRMDDIPKLVANVVGHASEAMKRHEQKNQQGRLITEVAPALIVPNAFGAELSEKCIRSFRSGKTFEGTVGAESGKAYRPEAKVRTDHIPPPALTAEIDDKLSRSLFPEIKKIFGFDVKFREQYKVGMYPGDKQGFFTAHRDNFDNPLGYRRVAMTLHLNDDFEGGGLRFPEYDNTVYRTDKGAAIIFSCATLHEALPVTKGDRFVLVGFFHGEEDDMYRRHYAVSKGQSINQRDFVPTLRQYPELNQSRDFYEQWKAQNAQAQQSAPAIPYGGIEVRDNSAAAHTQPQVISGMLQHKPTKVFESKGAVVIDNFLPEAMYNNLHQHMLRADYHYINTSKVSRAWHIHDGFPLGSDESAFYYADPSIRPIEGGLNYPSKTVFDPFIESILATQPDVQHITGQKAKDWWHLSVTGWLYPPGTGLSLHEDGSGVYSGAYVYFLNPDWKPHWGGQLLLMNERSNEKMRQYQTDNDKSDVYRAKWMHANRTDELIMDEGLAHCVFPKGNRIVFIASDAYHMVTKVNEQAGDNVRMSLAGFFISSKEPVRNASQIHGYD